MKCLKRLEVDHPEDGKKVREWLKDLLQKTMSVGYEDGVTIVQVMDEIEEVMK